jgi:septal ring factor EnvC (AmiA/AmiB activator)
MDTSRSLKDKLISQVEMEINRENDTIQLLRQEIKDREKRIEAILNQDTEARQLLQLLKKAQYQDNGTGVVPKPKKSVRERRQEYLDACRMLMDDQAKITLDALHDLMGGEEVEWLRRRSKYLLLEGTFVGRCFGSFLTGLLTESFVKTSTVT